MLRTEGPPLANHRDPESLVRVRDLRASSEARQRRASLAVAGQIWGIGRGETAGRTGSRQGRHSVMKPWAESADHGMTSSGSRFVAAANTSLANASAADASC